MYLAINPRSRDIAHFLRIRRAAQIHDARSGPHLYPHRIKPITHLTTDLRMSTPVKNRCGIHDLGTIGWWGVFASHARAAKWYLWTWLPRFLFEPTKITITGTLPHAFLYTSELFSYALQLFCFLYRIKVRAAYRYLPSKRFPKRRGAAVAMALGS